MWKTAHAAEVAIGTAAASVSSISWFIHDIVPLISAIGAFAGTFVALHGAYKIIRNWYHERQWPRN